MIEPISLGEAKVFKQLTLAIVGGQKSGKSRLAATGRPAILFLDYDLRSESLAGRKGVYAIKMSDPPHPIPQTVIPNVFDILTCLEKSHKLCDLVAGAIPQKLFPDASPDIEVTTVVHDSAESLARASLRYILSTCDDKLRFTTAVGTGAQRFIHYTPYSYVGWVADVAMVESIMLRTIATGLDTILILHESPEEAVDSTQETPKFTGKTTVYPVRYGRILKNFNEVWRMQLRPAGPNDGPAMKGRYVPECRVTQNWDFNASTCMLLDPVEAPDISRMLEKHIGKSNDQK